eukprot:scaffold535_cov260-Pinguiococcus_pyrenoidosus.AAC.2
MTRPAPSASWWTSAARACSRRTNGAAPLCTMRRSGTGCTPPSRCWPGVAMPFSALRTTSKCGGMDEPQKLEQPSGGGGTSPPTHVSSIDFPQGQSGVAVGAPR